MAQRRHHYERAFESLLRARRVPYIAVDEAKRALLPDKAPLKVQDAQNARPKAIKSFDFVVYSRATHLLVDVKGRKVATTTRTKRPKSENTTGRLESWVTEDDVRSLTTWQQLFGPGYQSVFLFLYWWEAQPPDGLFDDVFEHAGRWYAGRIVTLQDYAQYMRVRSPRWRTVHLARSDFDRVATPFRAVGIERFADPTIAPGVAPTPSTTPQD